ncbi:MAG: hypothetical protein ACRDPY_37520, partial [Streptosporangiaceae bacterium]
MVLSSIIATAKIGQGMLTPRGLCKTLFKEIQADGCPERGQECLQWPSIIGEKNPPGLQLGDR